MRPSGTCASCGSDPPPPTQVPSSRNDVAPLSLTTPLSGPSPTQLCLVTSSLLLIPRDPDPQDLPGSWKSSQSS
ncbi:ATP6V0E2 isoform 8 [Pongo abelii]|uniref:ATP6V0E2 isoform 1 n=1 Tax=Pongo abelii TaxID=9601 RepID=A0A2J8XR14_PONAB|nr:ATP6V0E2 isoform 1 [Pongo abelii]PNJ84447.1 ATP6V0E2 isoform 2 [Pongo abelii]PNJ84453.1 ATP6V0E2 isoform 8 [Pongo abelii]